MTFEGCENTAGASSRSGGLCRDKLPTVALEVIAAILKAEALVQEGDGPKHVVWLWINLISVIPHSVCGGV